MPCVDSVRTAPPMLLAHRVDGRARAHARSNTRNLSAATPARTISGHPPGISVRSDTNTTAAPATYTNSWTTSVQITAADPPRTVYTIIAVPMTMTAGVTGTCVTTEMTSAVA